MTKVWKRHNLGSQSMQEITERLDKAYNRFFKHLAKRPPKFKKEKDFSSFVFKQCGYKLEGNAIYISVEKTSTSLNSLCLEKYKATLKW